MYGMERAGGRVAGDGGRLAVDWRQSRVALVLPVVVVAVVVAIAPE